MRRYCNYCGAWTLILTVAGLAVRTTIASDCVRMPRRDSTHRARQQFYRHMQPHMREMQAVRLRLTQMRAEMARRRVDEPPSALLAYAMRMEHDRDRDDANSRVHEGIENVRMINEPIADYMYQGDMFLDLRQTEEMAADMERARRDEKQHAAEPPAFRYADASALRRSAAARYDDTQTGRRRAAGALKRLLGDDSALERAFDAALAALDRGRALKRAQTERHENVRARVRTGAKAQQSYSNSENGKNAGSYSENINSNLESVKNRANRLKFAETIGNGNKAGQDTVTPYSSPKSESSKYATDLNLSENSDRGKNTVNTVDNNGSVSHDRSLAAHTVDTIADAVANRLSNAPTRFKRQAQTGRSFPRNQWDPSVPIPYYFDDNLGAEARRVVRLAVQFWTENTCVTFAENGAGFPRVRFFAGGGCFSQVGRAFHSTEQMISIGKGCEQFGIAAHEIGHTLGFFHGQARNDRDDFVNIVYSNLSPVMATQFAKQSPDNNYNYGIKYDYGSVMHYSDTDSTTNRVTMLAKEKIYQHTMGNNVQPSFLDVFEMNIYYRCIENCPNGADCQHGGYRHPHNCSVCICPSGFGGVDCSESPLPENGPPVNCGREVEATEDFQALSASVSASSDLGLAERHATCYWHIRAPAGMRVEVRVRSVSGACADGCFYGGVEIKTRDFQRVGARPEDVPVEGYSGYPSDGAAAGSASLAPSQPTAAATVADATAGGDATESARCADVATNCYRLLALCDVAVYRELMSRQCRATCMRCDESTPTGVGGGGGGGGGGAINGAFCSLRDHENCPAWSLNGFCSSVHYSMQVKREICPRACNLC